jgi:hypothetical protein
MNGKQLAVGGSEPASILPCLLISGVVIGGVVVGLRLLFPDKKAETPDSGAENGNTSTNLSMPLPVSAPAAPSPAALPVPTVSAPAFPPLGKDRAIMREDLAAIFKNRGLTRMAAVSALKALGFGKTAAYNALSMDGRFAECLRFAPDGIITWSGQ